MSQDFLLTEKTVVDIAAQTDKAVLPANGDYSAIKINKNLSMTPQAQTSEVDEYTGEGSGNDIDIQQTRYDVSLNVYARGGGENAGSVLAPAYEALLLACGLRKIDVELIPVDDETGMVVGATLDQAYDVDKNASGTILFVLPGLLVVTKSAGEPFDLSADISQVSPAVTATPTAAPYVGILYQSTTDISQHQWAAIRYYQDAILKQTSGVALSYSLDSTLGSSPQFSFSGQGEYSDPAAEAAGNLPGEAQALPKVQSIGMVLGKRADDATPWTPANKGFKFNLSANVAAVNDANKPQGFDGFEVGSRSPSIDIEVQACTPDIMDLHAAWQAGTKLPFTAMVGSAVGNRIRLVAGRCQISSISDGTDNTRRTWSVTLQPKRDPNRADNDYGLIFC